MVSIPFRRWHLNPLWVDTDLKPTWQIHLTLTKHPITRPWLELWGWWYKLVELTLLLSAHYCHHTYHTIARDTSNVLCKLWDTLSESTTLEYSLTRHIQTVTLTLSMIDINGKHSMVMWSKIFLPMHLTQEESLLTYICGFIVTMQETKWQDNRAQGISYSWILHWSIV